MMGSELVIIGAGVVACILVYLMFKIGSSQSGELAGRKHFLLQLLLLFFVSYCLLFIGKAVVDESDHCAWLVDNSTVSGSTTSYETSYQCSTNINDTPLDFYTMILWFIRVLALYIFGYFTYEVLKFAGVVVPK